MSSVNTPTLRDKKTQPLSRDLEDRLDWLENQGRSAEDIRRVDAVFIRASSAVTLFWAILWTGVVGGVVAMTSGFIVLAN